MSYYQLQLPNSLLKHAEQMATRDQTSVNQLFVIAIAEKLSALQTQDVLERRAALADEDAYLEMLSRVKDVPVVDPLDEIPALL